jgi:hypothetical protein
MVSHETSPEGFAVNPTHAYMTLSVPPHSHTGILLNKLAYYGMYCKRASDTSFAELTSVLTAQIGFDSTGQVGVPGHSYPTC